MVLRTAMPTTLASATHAELLIKKSRFIACVQPCASRDEAVAVVRGLKAQHPGAAHVCWALMAGGQSAAVDDGEPSGTAGRPMLDVLRHQALEGVLATVVRYFGGVKLGAGGLVRAYTDAVATALLQAHKVELKRKTLQRFEVPYELEGRVRRILQDGGVELHEVMHGQAVCFAVLVEDETLRTWRRTMDEMGQGRLIWIEDDGNP